MVNRREFMCSALGMGATSMGLVLPEPARESGPLICRWYDCDMGGQWEMRIGYANDLDMFQNYGATLNGTLWLYSFNSPTWYAFRFGRFFHEYHADCLADAKKLAEYQLVEWLRRLTVQVERLAFA